MEYQLQFIPKFINSLKKFYSGYQLPATIVFDHNLAERSSPDCAICLSDICGGDRYRKLPECDHCFHAHCIDVWFESRSTCPLCRIQVPQITSLNQNHEYQLRVVLSGVVALVQDLIGKMCNPLNDELTSMLCANVNYIS